MRQRANEGDKFLLGAASRDPAVVIVDTEEDMGPSASHMHMQGPPRPPPPAAAFSARGHRMFAAYGSVVSSRSVPKLFAASLAVFLLWVTLSSSRQDAAVGGGAASAEQQQPEQQQQQQLQQQLRASRPSRQLPQWFDLFLPSPTQPRDTDACAGQWTEDALVGKCFGLAPVPEANTAAACRDHCCSLGADCTTWQFQGGEGGRGCMAGGPVRLGLELADTGNWCEPTAPAAWQGARLVNRKEKEGQEEGQCTWGEPIPYQCFGLGVEKLHPAEQRRRLTLAECRARCCGDAACELWQWREDKGCFAGVPGHCETDNLPFVGGRKKQPTKGKETPQEA